MLLVTPFKTPVKSRLVYRRFGGDAALNLLVSAHVRQQSDARLADNRKSVTALALTIQQFHSE